MIFQKVKKELFDKLTPKQKRYFRIMFAQAGVLYLKGAPGIAKSAIPRAIARKLEMNYIDIRLSTMDETDVGLYPYRNKVMVDFVGFDGTTIHDEIDTVSHAVPEWALLANQRPTIINFEELNRAQLPVRNAALQILLERSIGYKFKFNENVYMCASGNLGKEDGTEVEELDKALNNRLIHVLHDLTYEEWVSDFASENVINAVVSFLKYNGDVFIQSSTNKTGNSNSDAYATPRSWTNLSEYVVKNYGMNADIGVWYNDIIYITQSYVGDGAAIKFKSYLDNTMRITLDDVINNYKGMVDKLSACTQDRMTELLTTLKTKKLSSFKPKQIENIKLFLLSLPMDETVSYLIDLVKQPDYVLMPFNEGAVIDPSISENNVVIDDFMTDDRFDPHFEAIEKHIDLTSD